MKHLTNYQARKRTPEEIQRAYDARINNAIDTLPEKFFSRVVEIIDRKLTMPAQLIDVMATTKRALRETDTETDIRPQMREAAYYVVDQILQAKGGELTEFQKHRHSGSRVGNWPKYRNIYRFPPLKERKI